MRKNLFEVVADGIKEDIKKGKYKLDNLIPNEMELMAKYDVSRSTVREALKMLMAEGMIKPRAGIGNYVASTVDVNDYKNALKLCIQYFKNEYYKVTPEEFNLLHRVNDQLKYEEEREIKENELHEELERKEAEREKKRRSRRETYHVFRE